MKLTPKAYKRLVRVAQCVDDYEKWYQIGRTVAGQPEPAKALFKKRWPQVYKHAEHVNYNAIFKLAIVEITKGELDGNYAKAFA